MGSWGSIIHRSTKEARKESEISVLKPVVAVTIGDPSGIGPEIVAHLFSEYRPEASIPAIVGSRMVIEQWAKRFGLKLVEAETRFNFQSMGMMKKEEVLFLDTGCSDEFTKGKHCRGAGRHAAEAIMTACNLADSGEVAAIVTAPISKKALNLAGFEYPGHTEMLAAHFNTSTCEMMMVYEDLRIVPVTRHVPLSKVSTTVSKERILQCLKTVDEALRELFGIKEPRIALAALNPHAGDEGLIGEEEDLMAMPAVEEALKENMHVDGPIPGDVVFQNIEEKAYDAYVSMYHDQGLIPFKLVAGGKGVNLTIGLPIIRTSVDHGVAFDIAGKGKADIASLREAYLLAEKLSYKLDRFSKKMGQ